MKIGRTLTALVAALCLDYGACKESPQHPIYQHDVNVMDTSNFKGGLELPSDDISYDAGCKKKTFFEDKDKDGYGDKQMNVFACENPDLDWYVENFDDCDDTDPLIKPQGKEICNGRDDDCNGKTDERMEVIGPIEHDKTDNHPYCKKFQYEICKGMKGWDLTPPETFYDTEEICDNYDNDCNGLVDENLTKECFNECGAGKEDCEQGQWKNCNAPLPELEVCDGLDNDCDGITDKIIEQIDTECEIYDFAFVIDNSGSMAWKSYNQITYQGLQQLVENNWQEDYGLIVPFADISLAIGNFTSDKGVLLENIDKAKKTNVGSGTNIAWAVAETITFFPDDEHKKAIILLTDGEDYKITEAQKVNEKSQIKNIEICAYKIGSSTISLLEVLVDGIGGVEHIINAGDIAQKFFEAYMIFKCSDVFECIEGEMVKKTDGCAKGNDFQ